MNQDNRLWVLIARKLSGEATSADLKELESRMGENASDQYLFEILQAYWILHPEEQPVHENETEEGFRRIIAAGEESKEAEIFYPDFSRNNSMRFKKWIWAGGAAAILVLGLWLVNISSKNNISPKKATSPQQSEVMARRGTRSKIILPDGTQVWLNADSKITYQSSFNNELREVELDGEAFFDVVKDAKRPFVVHTSGIDIRVLGTAFNVKSYQQESTIETTLLRGMIEVTTRDDSKTPKVFLHPHEKLVFNKRDSELTLSGRDDLKPTSNITPVHDARMTVSPVILKPDSAMVETSWVYNKLIFEGENFKEVALKMERWYNVKINFSDEQLFKYRFKGTFQNESIHDALAAMKLTAKFDYRIDGNDVEILRSKD